MGYLLVGDIICADLLEEYEGEDAGVFYTETFLDHEPVFEELERLFLPFTFELERSPYGGVEDYKPRYDVMEIIDLQDIRDRSPVRDEQVGDT